MNTTHKLIRLAVAASVLAMTGACDAPEEAMEAGSEAADTLDLDNARRMEVLTAIETDSQRIEFVGLRGDAAEGFEPIVDIATFTEIGAVDEAEPLMDDGASPLEVFLRFSAEGAEPPAELVAHHEVFTARTGREPEIREYTQLPQISAWQTIQETTCSSLSNFQAYVSARVTNMVTDSSNADHDLSLVAPSSSSAGARPYMCNFSSSSHPCGADERKRAVVSAAGHGGASAVYDTYVYNCEMFRYLFSTRTAGTRYGISARDGEVVVRDTNGDFVGWSPSGRISYISMGWNN